MIIKTTYSIGEMVYLITDEQQRQRIIVGINIKPHDHVYALSCGEDESFHYDFEMSKEKNIMI
jgi:hypothetical protein